MKRLLAVATLTLILSVSNSFAAPQPPQLCYSANGLNISIEWTAVSGATEYTLHYAPFPFQGVHTIGSINMGGETSADYLLWENANYYIAITAKDTTGESPYSNIELFQLNPNANSQSMVSCSDSNISLIGGAWLEYRALDSGGPRAGTVDSCYEFYSDGSVYWHYVQDEGTPFEGTIQWQLDGNFLTFSLGHVTVTFTDTSDPNNYNAFMDWNGDDTAVRDWVRAESCDPWRGQ